MRLKFWLGLIVSLFIFIASARGQPAEPLVISAAEQYNFASYLFDIADYERAILEFRRLIYFFPDSDLVKPAQLGIADSYYRGGRIQQAIAELTKAIAQTSQQQLNSYHDELRYRLAINYLDLYSYAPYQLRQRSLNQAYQELAQISPAFEKAPAIAEFLSQTKIDISHDYKSPLAAALLSAVLPGVGSMYSGRVKEGWYSLLVVAMFVGAGYSADQSQHSAYHQSAPLFYSLATIFYGGAIYTAINSSYLYNSNLENERLAQLRLEYRIVF